MRSREKPDAPSAVRRLRYGWSVAIGFVILAGMVAGCDSLQRALVYPARHCDHAEFQARVQDRFREGVVVLPPFDAIVLEPSAPAVATAVWFHGNGSLNTNLAGLAPVVASRGVRLVLAEYPGYGARTGKLSESSFVGDAGELYRIVRQRFSQEPVIVIGQSLGSGVAAQVAADAITKPPDRLVLATSFIDLSDAASHAFWDLPVQSLVSDRYDSGSALTRCAGPVFVVVAAKDRFVGAESGRRLARVSRRQGETRVIELEQANHDNWLSTMSAADWNVVLDGLASRPPESAK